MPGHLRNIWDVVHAWREDALQLLRADVPRLLPIIIYALVLLWLLRTIRRKLNDFAQRQQSTGLRVQQLRTLSSVIYSVGVFVICFMALLNILEVFNINIGPLLASAGVAGLAIGFGAQTLVKDVINGFFILLENQYDIGDVVKIASVQGTVEGITMRRTILRDADGSVHNVPNSQINIVSNLTRDWTQVSMHVTVSYTEDSDRVIELLKEIGQEIKGDPIYGDLLVAEPEVPGIDKVAGGEVDYLMLVKTRPGQQWPVQRELRRRIKHCFETNNIQPGPTRLYVVESTPK